MQKRKTSAKRRVIIFSVIMFLVIFIGGSTAFVFSMWRNLNNTAGSKLAQSLEIERIKLEASVNGEIAIALKMAASPLIIRQFLNPSDAMLKRIAFDEIEGYRQAFASNMVFWASNIDKEFYFAEDNHYTIDAEDPENYWYKMTLYETERFNFNINYNSEIQSKVSCSGSTRLCLIPATLPSALSEQVLTLRSLSITFIRAIPAAPNCIFLTL
jgi:methyl-accepting chemotaxis protein